MNESPYTTWCRCCDAAIPPYAQHDCRDNKSRFNVAGWWRRWRS